MPLAPPIRQIDRTWVLHRGRRLAYFGGCDYFRLASHPAVLRALHQGATEFGLNVAASRSTTGNHAIYAGLENTLADFFGAPAALLVASGYATNLVVAQALAGEFTHALIDERAHASLVDAASFLGCDVTKFPHRNPAAVAKLARESGPKAKLLLLTDGMFSHEGSAAPLDEYLRVLPRTGLVLVDDAHGAGVLGAKGRGTVEHAGVSRARLVQTISLSKAFGVYGGAVLCTRELRLKIIERSRLFSGNTPLPIPLASAAIRAVGLLRRNPSWRARMNANAAFVKQALRSGGVDVPECPGPIVAVTPRDRAEASRLRRRLLARGVFPSFIQYPGGPPAGYFRFMISSEHTRQQLVALAAALAG